MTNAEAGWPQIRDHTVAVGIPMQTKMGQLHRNLDTLGTENRLWLPGKYGMAPLDQRRRCVVYLLAIIFFTCSPSRVRDDSRRCQS